MPKVIFKPNKPDGCLAGIINAFGKLLFLFAGIFCVLWALFAVLGVFVSIMEGSAAVWGAIIMLVITVLLSIWCFRLFKTTYRR